MAWCLAMLILPPCVQAQSFCEPVTVDSIAGATVLGDGSPGSVTTAQIQNALDSGGPISFDLGTDPSTIFITSTLIASGPLVLDGGLVPTLAIDETSPAFNSGVCGADIPPTDARGQARIDAVDRGSYEFDSMELVFRSGFEGP